MTVDDVERQALLATADWAFIQYGNHRIHRQSARRRRHRFQRGDRPADLPSLWLTSAEIKIVEGQE